MLHDVIVIDRYFIILKRLLIASQTIETGRDDRRPNHNGNFPVSDINQVFGDVIGPLEVIENHVIEIFSTNFATYQNQGKLLGYQILNNGFLESGGRKNQAAHTHMEQQRDVCFHALRLFIGAAKNDVVPFLVSFILHPPRKLRVKWISNVGDNHSD